MGPVVTLAVTRDALLTVLTGNTDLVHGLFRTIAESTTGSRTPPVVNATAADFVTSAGTELTLVQRVVVLQQVEALAHVPADELAQLAAIAREVPLVEGTLLSAETDLPVVCIVVRGGLSYSVMRPAQRPAMLVPATPSVYSRRWRVRRPARTDGTRSGSWSRVPGQRCSWSKTTYSI